MILLIMVSTAIVKSAVVTTDLFCLLHPQNRTRDTLTMKEKQKQSMVLKLEMDRLKNYQGEVRLAFLLFPCLLLLVVACRCLLLFVVACFCLLLTCPVG